MKDVYEKEKIIQGVIHVDDEFFVDILKPPPTQKEINDNIKRVKVITSVKTQKMLIVISVSVTLFVLAVLSTQPKFIFFNYCCYSNHSDSNDSK